MSSSSGLALGRPVGEIGAPDPGGADPRAVFERRPGASFFRMHPGSPAEPVLAAWGITTDGKPAFAGLAPGSGESADAWHDLGSG